ncbi:MAG: hypothetical protein K2R98_16735 [Gemmataceae bacterium]|nr:hypothetical protein [Gemmataceae bacterium]
MTEYQIQANTRRCAGSGRELRPGERVYTVLLDEAGKFVRQDYSTEAWTGPPSNAFSFWVARLPKDEESRRPRIDDELLLDCFRRLQGQVEPDRVNFRYVLALLLMRRKRLKFEDARTEGDQEILRLRCAKTREQHEVVNPRLADDEMAGVQEEVFKVLGWE